MLPKPFIESAHPELATNGFDLYMRLLHDAFVLPFTDPIMLIFLSIFVVFAVAFTFPALLRYNQKRRDREFYNQTIVLARINDEIFFFSSAGV